MAESKWESQYPQYTVNTGWGGTSTTPSLDALSWLISEARRESKLVYLIANVQRDDCVYRFDEKYTQPGYTVFVGSRRVYELVSTATLSTTPTPPTTPTHPLPTPPLAGVFGTGWTAFHACADLGAMSIHDAAEMLQRYLTPEGVLATLRATWTFSGDVERSGVETVENDEADNAKQGG